MLLTKLKNKRNYTESAYLVDVKHTALEMLQVQICLWAHRQTRTRTRTHTGQSILFKILKIFIGINQLRA